MREIQCIAREIRENIREAREKIGKAYEMMEKDRAHADWEKEMAMAHLAFNSRGHEIVKKMIGELADNTSPLAPGMRAVYEEMHADMMREAAEVKAMIDGYGR